MKTRQIYSLFAIAMLALVHNTGQAQSAKTTAALNYPMKSIRWVLALTPGGNTDALARIIAQPLSEALGQPVVVDNRPGAGGIIGVDLVVKAPADGYTLLMGTTGPMAINPSLYSKLPYDPLRDLAPIIMIATSPYIVATHPSVPVTSIKELIALAKAKPGQLNSGATLSGTAHVAAEFFNSVAGISIVFIPYKGGAPATADLLGGHIQVGFASPMAFMPLAKAGKLKALAVMSAKRLDKYPEIPTMEESGLKGFVVNDWYGVLAPAGTPREIILRLNAEIAKIIQNPTYQERLRDIDFVLTPTSPEQFGTFIKSETESFGKVIKSAGMHAE
jgi:tripartite-type tricarboxylate transporter receptor subunit TctC